MARLGALDNSLLLASRMLLLKVFASLLWIIGLLLVSPAHAQTSLLGPVDRDYFGLALYRADAQTPWPAVPFGAWRMWDAYVTWFDLEPDRGRWDFSRLDRYVNEAAAHDVKVLLVLAHSPVWAAARPAERGAYGLARSSEPADIADWRNYVRTVASRYKGRILEYQVWNEPSDKTHYSGTVEKLIEMTCEAYKVLKSIDGNIKLVSGGSAGGGGHVKYLDSFLAQGGAKCIDVVAHHFYAPRFAPEAMVPLIREVRAVMQARSVAHLPLWNTETGWWIANTDGVPEQDASPKGGWRKLDAGLEMGSVVQRALLLARAEGVARFYWYAWSNRIWGLADAKGNPKAGLVYWTELFELILGRQIVACRQDDGTYACDIRDPGQQIKTLKWRDSSALVSREGPREMPASVSGLPR